MKKYINKEDLKKMKNNIQGTCVSIYLPTPRANIDNKKNSIKLKNILTKVEEQLKDLNYSLEEIQKFVRTANRFLIDNAALGKLSKSVVIFYTNKKTYCFILPVSFEEIVKIENDLYLEPLEEFFKTMEQNYYILLLSQKKIKLYQATPYEMIEIILKDIPKSLKDFLNNDDFNQGLQFHTKTPPSKGERAAIFYSSGDKKADDKKNQLVRYFSIINNNIFKTLNKSKSPLILVGVEYLFPLYKSVNTYPYLYKHGVKGSPDKMPKNKMHIETLKILGY